MRSLVSLCVGVTLSAVSLGAAAQQPAPPTGRAAAQVDITGHWVAQITEDWRWRMITPPKGDFSSVPLNALGRQTAEAWDPAQDVANGEQCRAFGVGGLMRQPTRLEIAWEDDATLRIETDAGQQVRRLHFGAPPPADTAPTWQGYSVAEWTRELPPPNPFGPLVAPTSEAAAARAGNAGAGAARAARPAPPAPDGALKVVTTHVRAGYLRKNGVPYSDRATVTEYYDKLTLFGTDYLQVLTIVDDPQYLTTPFIVSNHFKREPDRSKWQPTPCETPPPLGTLQRPEFIP
jgi:hypothetical protein